MEPTLTKPTPPGHIITQKSINDLDGHWLIGVLSALVVALISGVVNNIPYIGSMIAVSYTHLTLPTTPYV